MEAADNADGSAIHPVQGGAPPSAAQTFNDDVDKIQQSTSQSAKTTGPNAQAKKPSNLTVIDLSGKRIRDDNKEESDSASQAESPFVDSADLVFEPPFSMFSFYNMIK